MSDQFKAIVLNQEGENFSREVKSLDKSFLKHGDVTVKVDYSDLNFKDGMILKNGGRLVKEYPHIPGIDFSRTVIESDNPKFKKGEEVTDDYRIFSTYHDTTFTQPPGKIENLKPWPQKLLSYWDKHVAESLLEINDVEQPLRDFVEEKIFQSLNGYISGEQSYKSVSEALPLRYRLQTASQFS